MVPNNFLQHSLIQRCWCLRNKQKSIFTQHETCDPSTLIPCFFKKSVAEKGMLNNLISEISLFADNFFDSLMLPANKYVM
jgi:hypothetical protein